MTYAAVLPAAVAGVGLHVDTTAYVFNFFHYFMRSWVHTVSCVSVVYTYFIRQLSMLVLSVLLKPFIRPYFYSFVSKFRIKMNE